MSWGPRSGSASHGRHEVAVAGGAPRRDAVGRRRKRLPGAGQSSADRGSAAADSREDGAGGRAGNGPQVQAAPGRAAPQSLTGARLRRPQVRRGAAARGARGGASRLSVVRSHPRYVRPPPRARESPHRADRRILRSRFERAVRAERHRSVPTTHRRVARVGPRAAARVCQPRLPHPTEAAERSALGGPGGSGRPGHVCADRRAHAGAAPRDAAPGVVLAATGSGVAAAGPDAGVRAGPALAA